MGQLTGFQARPELCRRGPTKLKAKKHPAPKNCQQNPNQDYPKFSMAEVSSYKMKMYEALMSSPLQDIKIVRSREDYLSSGKYFDRE